MAIAVGGTHPTGMHSCCKTDFLLIHSNYLLIWRSIYFWYFLFPLQFQITSDRCIISAAWPSLLVKRFTGIFLIFEEFNLPLIILSYCYGRILFVLTRRLDSNLSTGNQSDQFQLARKNTIKTFMIVAVCFVTCWSNNQIYFLMHNLGYKINLDGVYYKFTIFMVFLNCTINPLSIS